MKKTAIVSSSVLTAFLLAATSVTAATIEGNTSSSVKINNSVNSSNTSVIQSNSQSKVTITCDGKTYTYESNGEDLNANPCEGSSVKINNNGSTQTSTVTPPNPTQIKEQVEQKKAEVKKKIEDEKAKIKATITAIPKPTSSPTFSLDLGAWIRSLILSFFK